MWSWVCNFQAKLICSWSYFLGIPSWKLGLLALAHALPSWVRLTIKSRSNSAKALKTVKIKRPLGELSIVPIFKTHRMTPSAFIFFTILSASWVFLAKRSNLVTIKVSPFLILAINLSNSGRSAVVPVYLSLKILVAPARFKSSICVA